MRFHVLNTSRSPHTEGLRAACPEPIGLVFRLRGQPIYHRTARWMSVDDLVTDIERICFGVRYGIIEVRFNDPSGDPLDEEALRGIVSKVGELKNKVVKGKATDVSEAFDRFARKPKKVLVKPKKEEIKPPPKPEPKPEPEPPPEEVPESEEDEGDESYDSKKKAGLDDLSVPPEKKEAEKTKTKPKKKKRATSKKSD